jgi:sec-independent protein translocase protein TatA
MKNILLLGMPGGPEWIFILIIVLVIFGGKKLPGLMKGMGKGIRGFKDEMAGDSNDDDSKDKSKIEE